MHFEETVYRLVAFALLLAGLFTLFHVNAGELLFAKAARAYEKRRGVLRAAEEKRRFIVGKELSFYTRKKLEIEAILRQNNRRGGSGGLLRNMLLCGGAGFAAGALLDNFFLAVVLLFGLGSIPLMLLVLARDRYLAMVNDKLELALNAVTTQYIQNDDIGKSVALVIDRVPEPITETFREFISETMYINSNVKRAIERMRSKIDNRYFHAWCDTLIQCQDDNMIKFVLPSIIESMSDVKKMQEEFNTTLLSVHKEYTTMVLIEALFIPLLYVMQKEWFHVLLTSGIGKAVLAVNAAVILLGYAYIIVINRPVSQI